MSSQNPHVRVADMPAVIGVRLICLSLLDDAIAARDRLDDTDDADALHDFRVALRRLRSTTRTYDSLLADTIGRKLRKLVRRIARSTGASRDLEVHIDWLSNVERASQTYGGVAQELAARLNGRKAEADRAMLRVIDRDFDRFRRRMKTALVRYEGVIDPARPLGESTAEAAGVRVAHLADELEMHLAEVRTVEQQEEAHMSRIAIKRLRYIVEPFGRDVVGADRVVESLKEMQTSLGDLHDMNALIAEVDDWLKNGSSSDDSWKHGLQRLRTEVCRQRDLLFTRTRDTWLDANGRTLLHQARDLAATLSGRGNFTALQ